jgi:MFS family permease
VHRIIKVARCRVGESVSEFVARQNPPRDADLMEASVRNPRGTVASERSLDLLAFFLADVADGLGPFLVIDLTTRREWSATRAGLAMAALLVGTVLSQTFTGAWMDRTRWKRMAITIAAATVAAASVGLYYVESTPGIIGLQLVTGIAVTVFPPALAAISLGLVGRRRFAARAGRNEAFFHAGNVVSAALAICASQLWGTAGVFYAAALMALLSAIRAQFIRESDIDHNLARGADRDEPQGLATDAPSVISPWELLRDQRLLWLIASVVLFHFANAAMLPLVGQKVGHQSNPSEASSLMALCIIVAQVTMVPVAILASRWAVFSRWSVFLIALSVLPVRGLLYTLTDSHLWLIAIQALDGIGAGIFGVVALLMVADLTKGTGRFNLAQGMMATAIGLGAAASQFTTGMLVDTLGYNAGFVFLAGIAILSLVVFVNRVPETKESQMQSHSG